MPPETMNEFLESLFWKLSAASTRVHADVQAVHDLWNRATKADSKLHNPNFAPGYAQETAFVRYTIDFTETFIDASYDIDTLRTFTGCEASNVTQFYVAHYFTDYIGRVKTGLDLLALILNSVYSLGLDEKRCALEGGPLSSKLCEASAASQKKIGRAISRHRNRWIKSFCALRNIAVHRHGFQYTLNGMGGYPIGLHILLPDSFRDAGSIPIDPEKPIEFLRTQSDVDDLVKFLHEIGSESASPYLMVNPIVLCEEIWTLWCKTTDDVLGECKQDILDKLPPEAPLKCRMHRCSKHAWPKYRRCSSRRFWVGPPLVFSHTQNMAPVWGRW